MFNWEEIKPAVVSMLRVNMGLKEGESLLVVNDVPGPEDWYRGFAEIKDLARRSVLARSIYELCREEFKDNRVDYLVYPALGQSGQEPPGFVAEKLPAYDVVILLTTYSLSHTNAREKATRAGARIASMPGIEYEMFLPGGPMAVDYAAIRKETETLAAMLTGAQTVRVVTDLGTDLTFSIAGREGGPDTGIYDARGEWGNLPGGEAFVAPVEGTANGKLVVPKGWYPGLTEDMVLEFKEGYVVSLQGGGRVGAEFTRLLAFGNDSLKHRRNCAELGIGTNPKARKPDNVLEAEKIKGTIHIAIGDSSHLGGVTESDLHEDFVIPHPRLYLDGELVLGK
ncbi:aminopeptidase [Desulfurispora thermophila]|uniref:aminopeptidase n=1 Tax=Desulfurispora thermophila TaxID=265470 RepID=UPI0003772B3D|nr:aminopeptidase [Desulfurispora thermophila]